MNMYETDPYFFQFFQSNTTVCLIIYLFCKSCELEPEPEPEIVFVFIFVSKTISGSDSGSQLLQNAYLNQHCHALEVMMKISIHLAVHVLVFVRFKSKTDLNLQTK